MTAQVYIVLDKAEDAILVPSSALRRGERGQSVRVLNAEGKPEMRRVKVGIDNNINAQILEGLDVGERVIIGSALPSDGRAQQQGSQRRVPRMRF